LWDCRKRGHPLLRELSRLSRRRCQECERARTLNTGAGLPSAVADLWTRLRKVLNLRAVCQRKRLRAMGLPAGELARRRRRVDGARARRAQRVLTDARRVQTGTLALHQWEERHYDVRKRSVVHGRLPDHSARTKGSQKSAQVRYEATERAAEARMRARPATGQST